MGGCQLSIHPQIDPGAPRPLSCPNSHTWANSVGNGCAVYTPQTPFPQQSQCFSDSQRNTFALLVPSNLTLRLPNSLSPAPLLPPLGPAESRQEVTAQAHLVHPGPQWWGQPAPRGLATSRCRLPTGGSLVWGEWIFPLEKLVVLGQMDSGATGVKATTSLPVENKGTLCEALCAAVERRLWEAGVCFGVQHLHLAALLGGRRGPGSRAAAGHPRGRQVPARPWALPC